MSGRGERPAEDDGDVQAEETADSVTVGETVFDESGEPLGRIRGYEAGGFFVSTRAGMEAMSIDHARSGHAYGEAHLVWRYRNGGEVGAIDDGMPEQCPNCGVEKERLMWWTED